MSANQKTGRHVRAMVPFLNGDRYHDKGDVILVPCDRRARQLVDQGHAEFVAPVAAAFDDETADATPAADPRAERATAGPRRGRAGRPRPQAPPADGGDGDGDGEGEDE